MMMMSRQWSTVSYLSQPYPTSVHYVREFLSSFWMAFSQALEDLMVLHDLCLHALSSSAFMLVPVTPQGQYHFGFRSPVTSY